MAPIETRTRIVSLESGALPACPFPAGTLIICCAVYEYLFVHCAHFIALSMSFHYTCKCNSMSYAIIRVSLGVCKLIKTSKVSFGVMLNKRSFKK